MMSSMALTMTQRRLNDLALLNIENDVVKNIDFIELCFFGIAQLAVDDMVTLTSSCLWHIFLSGHFLSFLFLWHFFSE